MPRAPKVCPKCSNPQPCPTHHKVPWQGSTRRSRLPKDWEHRRRQVLDDQPVCAICNNALAVVCDHIVPGDNHHRSNLQGICTSCDRTKSAYEGQTAR